jgi:hypothetical protein
MADQKLLEELMAKISPMFDTEEERMAVPVYLESDKYREKLLAFLEMAERKGDRYSADLLLLLVLVLSKEEEKELG